MHQKDIAEAYAKFIDRELRLPPLLYTLTTAAHRGDEYWTKSIPLWIGWIAHQLHTPGLWICGFSEPQRRGATHYHGLIQPRGQWQRDKLPYRAATLAWNQVAAGWRCGQCDPEWHGMARIERIKSNRAGVRYAAKYVAKNADMIPPTYITRTPSEELPTLTGCVCRQGNGRSQRRRSNQSRGGQPKLHTATHRTRRRKTPHHSR